MFWRRLIHLFLAALAALALGGSGTASASGQTAVGAKTHVGASDLAAEGLLGGRSGETPGRTTPGNYDPKRRATPLPAQAGDEGTGVMQRAMSRAELDVA